MEHRVKQLHAGLALMMLLLTLLLLWSAEALGGWGILLLPLLLVPTCVLTFEKQYLSLFFAVVLPAALLLFLPFGHYAWFGFVAILSWYAPVRTLLMRFRAAWIGSLLALLFCNLGAVFGFWGLSLLGVFPLAELDPFWLVLLITGCEIGFLLLDIFYQLFRRFYLKRFRRFLFV